MASRENSQFWRVLMLDTNRSGRNWFNASADYAGHAKIPDSSRLAMTQKPEPSQSRSLISVRRRLQKAKT